MNFVPLSIYSFVYFNFLLAISLFMMMDAYRLTLTDKSNLKAKNIVGIFVFTLIVCYIGLRPISGLFFGDMATYAFEFQSYQSGSEVLFKQDIGFNYFMILCAKLFDLKSFFFLCATIYVVPLYLASRKWFKQFWFYAFYILVASFSFWSYGTNGIRNGLATSLLVLAFAYYDKKIVFIIAMLIAVSFHKSVTLPAIAFVFSLFYHDSKHVFYFWLLCIPLSIIGGGFFESFFGKLGFNDSRLTYFTAGNINGDNFSSTGFRWDFLLYSSIGTFSGWYFLIKKGYKDKVYEILFSTYLIANGFWILIIRANFSNRFAYLSWFMLGVVVIYPLLKKQFFKNQHVVLINVIFLYFMFTYLLNVILIRR